MDMIKIFERFRPGSITKVYDYPKYNFRRENESFYSLIVQPDNATNINDRICEIFFSENDLIDLIMKAEMVLH